MADIDDPMQEEEERETRDESGTGGPGGSGGIGRISYNQGHTRQITFKVRTTSDTGVHSGRFNVTSGLVFDVLQRQQVGVRQLVNVTQMKPINLKCVATTSSANASTLDGLLVGIPNQFAAGSDIYMRDQVYTYNTGLTGQPPNYFYTWPALVANRDDYWLTYNTASGDPTGGTILFYVEGGAKYVVCTMTVKIVYNGPMAYIDTMPTFNESVQERASDKKKALLKHVRELSYNVST